MKRACHDFTLSSFKGKEIAEQQAILGQIEARIAVCNSCRVVSELNSIANIGRRELGLSIQ